MEELLPDQNAKQVINWKPGDESSAEEIAHAFRKSDTQGPLNNLFICSFLEYHLGGGGLYQFLTFFFMTSVDR